jgi:hypothetical protein
VAEWERKRNGVRGVTGKVFPLGLREEDFMGRTWVHVITRGYYVDFKGVSSLNVVSGTTNGKFRLI